MKYSIDQHRKDVGMIKDEFKQRFSEICSSFNDGQETSQYYANRANILDGHIQSLEKISFEENEILLNFFNLQNIRLQALLEFNSYCSKLTSEKYN